MRSRWTSVGCAAGLLGCCLVAPAARATKCSPTTEERRYEVVEVVAMDGGPVPDAVAQPWADGVTLVARVNGVALHRGARGDEGGIIFEVEP